jgi:hypothetical protein
LLELPRGLTATQLAGGFGMPGAQALSGRIEESYIRRLQPLPEDARLLLLVAAAEPIGDPLLLLRASERLGIDVSAVEATDGLLDLGESVTFRHPLVRSAVYRSAGAPERRAAHLALAEVTDRNTSTGWSRRPRSIGRCPWETTRSPPQPSSTDTRRPACARFWPPTARGDPAPRRRDNVNG